MLSRDLVELCSDHDIRVVGPEKAPLQVIWATEDGEVQRMLRVWVVHNRQPFDGKVRS